MSGKPKKRPPNGPPSPESERLDKRLALEAEIKSKKREVHHVASLLIHDIYRCSWTARHFYHFAPFLFVDPTTEFPWDRYAVRWVRRWVPLAWRVKLQASVLRVEWEELVPRPSPHLPAGEPERVEFIRAEFLRLVVEPRNRVLRDEIEESVGKRLVRDARHVEYYHTLFEMMKSVTEQKAHAALAVLTRALAPSSTAVPHTDQSPTRPAAVTKLIAAQDTPISDALTVEQRRASAPATPETSPELEVTRIARPQPLVPANGAPLASPPPEPPVLTPVERAVLDILLAVPPGRGILGKDILEELDEMGLRNTGQGDLTGRIIPKLRSLGVVINNPRGGRGYWVVRARLPEWVNRLPPPGQ